ncbi:ABC transporter permease [Pseudanabaena sp. Chao 1811]|uniref:ABC transporter permease n=1 Tax=Pseudanabaena sp. Chao 1811 TaxID=2963092 RepID=UPI0022F3E82B|nr:ABC transporter permease [Pseudanabaena sp. Chao 1811]
MKSVRKQIRKISIAGFTSQDARFIFNFLKMNIHDRYLGSTLGSLWVILNPMIMFAIYTFVFGYVFKAKIPGAETNLGYAIWLIAGYGPWLAISEGLLNSTTSVVAGAGLIKNLAFKTELLPVAAALTGMVPLFVSLCFLTILLGIDGNPMSWHVIFVIPAIILQFTFIIAIGFFFSAINVFVRDFGIILPNLLIMLVFVTPIFYPETSTPPLLQSISAFNPFYIICQAYRQALIFHQIPNILSLIYVGLISWILGNFGLQFFRRLKGNFESML